MRRASGKSTLRSQAAVAPGPPLSPWAVVITLVILWLLAVGSGRAEETKSTVRKHAPAAQGAVRGFLPAFFEHSLVDVARAQARSALKRNPRDVEALFVEMEAAAIQADTSAELDAAVRLLEIRAAQRDDRVAIAAARVADEAGNTQDFRAILPRIEAMLRTPHAQASYLRAALISAAVDGAPGINARQIARDAGLLTDWRVVGPFGKYPDLEFNRAWGPQEDGLDQPDSDAHAIERFHFANGKVELPDYFERTGVFYAEAESTASGEVLVRVESAGTMEVFVDGASALRKDDRFRSGPRVSVSRLRLSPGTHKVVVKFVPAALPFQVAIDRETRTAAGKPLGYAAEAAYVAAAKKYWEGDYAGAIAGFDRLRDMNASAATEWMLYLSWVGSDQNAPEATALLNQVTSNTPEALAAEFEVARRAYAAERVDDAVRTLDQVLAKRPRFAPAQDLMAEIAMRMHWPLRASRAIEILLDIHPSCDTLRKAQHFFAGYAKYDRAHKVDDDLKNCSLDSLAYATSLSDAGEHAAAAEAAQNVVTGNPLDRAAREFTAKQWALAGRTGEARAAIEELAAIAPNSKRYRAMAAAAKLGLDAMLDTSHPEIEDAPFYAAYRRDGEDMVKQTASRKFSGGPAVVLLDDQVARLWPDGSASLYVHRITRPLDRGGVEKYGEVELPPRAEILELRTIKANGEIAEPELQQQKATISMPGLLPGDAVDVEYIVRGANREQAFAHTFGSFHAPILYSKFVAITPRGGESVQASAAAPGFAESTANGEQVRVWERNDIAQSVEESASASGDILPTVRVTPALYRGWEDVRDWAREIVVEASRVGPRVRRYAAGQVVAASDEAQARALYREVVTTIAAAGGAFGKDLPSAEDTLARHSGSRTMALLALAHAEGLQADLVLARNSGAVAGMGAPAPSMSAYTRPLVRFHLRSHDVVVDAESDGLAFGALPPAIAHTDSLAITLPDENNAAAVETAILKLPLRQSMEESVARGEITIEGNGDLSADVSIVLGAWRGAQMRSMLAGTGAAARGPFFQQLAARIFPGAENVTGEVRNEQNPDKSLELVLHCTASHYVNLTRGTADLEQLVPGLGLKKMYASGSSRQFPLYVDAPLFETATFRVHLPPGVGVARAMSDTQVASDFGKYSVSFREIEDGVLEVKRSFNIPVQIVPVQRFQEFVKFASQIDDAERQKIGLERDLAAAGR